ncbi:MAG: hypothetical protein RR537_07855 [Longicatena sp.]
MKPSEFQKTIQCQFDCLAKTVIRTTVKDYQKGLARRSKKEIPFCDLPEMTIEQLSSCENLYVDINSFHVCESEIRVLDEQLYKALKNFRLRKEISC